MVNDIPNLIPAIPEMFVLGMICVTLMIELFVPQKNQIVTYGASLVTLIGAFAFSLYLFHLPVTTTFYGMYIHDELSSLLKIIVYVMSFFAFIYAYPYIKERKINVGEYYILALLSVLGMMVLVSANNLLVLFLGLEILSLPLYALAALWRTNETASEAAMKYYVMGAMASALLLYGLSLLYGAAQSLAVPDIMKVIANTPISQQLIFYFALIFIVGGLAFKLGAAPFHMWVPDVYQGAPTSVTLFIGSAPKIAALGMTFRLLAEALPSLHVEWQQLLIVVAILSMALGNIVAIMQTNIKRMLAYSSIAHMGYMILGLLTNDPSGYAAALFYMVIYAIMSLGAFAIVAMMSQKGIEAEDIADYQGLNSRSPWLAFMMLLLMFSMAGIPPTAGFFAKLGVLQALVSAHFVWLAAIALIFAVIGSYYYLAIVKVMYFEEAVVSTPIHHSKNMSLAISINSMAILFLGLFPTQAIDLCRQAFQIL